MESLGKLCGDLIEDEASDLATTQTRGQELVATHKISTTSGRRDDYVRAKDKRRSLLVLRYAAVPAKLPPQECAQPPGSRWETQNGKPITYR